jgi:hypothetical protein
LAAAVVVARAPIDGHKRRACRQRREVGRERGRKDHIECGHHESGAIQELDLQHVCCRRHRHSRKQQRSRNICRNKQRPPPQAVDPGPTGAPAGCGHAAGYGQLPPRRVSACAGTPARRLANGRRPASRVYEEGLAWGARALPQRRKACSATPGHRRPSDKTAPVREGSTWYQAFFRWSGVGLHATQRHRDLEVPEQTGPAQRPRDGYAVSGHDSSKTWSRERWGQRSPRQCRARATLHALSAGMVGGNERNGLFARGVVESVAKVARTGA